MLNISEKPIPHGVVNEITKTISMNPQVAFGIDKLLFSNDSAEKISLIKSLAQNDFEGDIKVIWSSVLLEEAKKIKG